MKSIVHINFVTIGLTRPEMLKCKDWMVIQIQKVKSQKFSNP